MATENKAFRVHYFHKWVSFFNKKCRIELLRESDKSVTPIEILSSIKSNTKVNFPSNDNADKHFPIWGATLDFNFYEQVENVSKGIKRVSLDDVVADFEREVRCDLYVDELLIYRGWQAPDQCEDFPHRNNKSIYLTFIDGVGSLDSFPILTTQADEIMISQVSEYGYYGANLMNATNNLQNYDSTKESVFNIIKLCLLKAQMDFGFKVINDIYEIGLQTTDVRVFEKVFVDYLSYSKDKSSLNCAEVLKSIFRIFGLVVYQKYGFWNIVRVAYLESKLVDIEVYDKDGKFQITIEKYQTTNTLNPLESEDNTPKKWNIKEEGFTRISNPPCQYQNIIYEYNEDLIVNSYDANKWEVRGIDAVEKTIGKDVYLKLNDTRYKYPEALVGIINNSPGDDSSRNKAKNTEMLNFIKSGVYSQEIQIYNDNEITFTLTGIFQKIIFYVFITDQNGIIYHFIPSINRWINRDLFFNKVGDFEMTSPDLIASTLEFVREKDVKNTIEGLYEMKFIINQNNTIKTYKNTGKKIKILNFELPVFEKVKGDVITGKLTIVLRGGSNNTNLNPTEVYLRNIKVKIDQVKETHTFTNAGRVSYTPADITVLNGDGNGTGFSKSSLFIRKEITTFPYTSNPFPTKLWKDSSHQVANNLLSFTAEMVVNAYAKRSNIVKAKIRTKQKLWVGDIIRMPSYSKLGYGKYLIMPAFNYDVSEDVYDLTLFQITCDTAKGNTLEYYLDSNGSSIFRSQTFSDGYICEQTFESEGICIEEGFTALPICI